MKEIVVNIQSRLTVATIEPKVPYAMICITEPNATFPSINMGARDTLLKGAIFVKFADTESPESEYPGLTLYQGSLLASFIEVYVPQVEAFLINCDAGVSRSAAVAAAILQYTSGDDSFVFGNSRYRPNMYVYRTLVNELMGPPFFDDTSFPEFDIYGDVVR